MNLAQEAGSPKNDLPNFVAARCRPEACGLALCDVNMRLPAPAQRHSCPPHYSAYQACLQASTCPAPPTGLRATSSTTGYWVLLSQDDIVD